jgi:hypothetical protein
VGVGVGCLQRRQHHSGALRPEHLVEPAAELRVTITNKDADPASSFLEDKQQVAGLLGDPQTVGISGDPGQVDPSAVQLDEEQHVQPLQPDRVDGEEVARNDPGGLLA